MKRTLRGQLYIDSFCKPRAIYKKKQKRTDRHGYAYIYRLGRDAIPERESGVEYQPFIVMTQSPRGLIWANVVLGRS